MSLPPMRPRCSNAGASSGAGACHIGTGRACRLTRPNACCLAFPAETNGPAPQFVQSAPQMYYGAPPPQQAMY